LRLSRNGTASDLKITGHRYFDRIRLMVALLPSTCERRQAKETKHMSTAIYTFLHAILGLVGIGSRMPACLASAHKSSLHAISANAPLN
jgi:hypothetical protein